MQQSSLTYKYLNHAIENTANQKTWKPLCTRRYYVKPCAYVALIVLVSVFSMAWLHNNKQVLSIPRNYKWLVGYIPLTNRVRGPYCKLRTEFFSLRFMAQARCARAMNRRGKKRGSVTYSTDREDEASKIFIISLLCAWRARERFLVTPNGFKFLTQIGSKTSQFDFVFKS